MATPGPLSLTTMPVQESFVGHISHLTQSDRSRARTELADIATLINTFAQASHSGMKRTRSSRKDCLASLAIKVFLPISKSNVLGNHGEDVKEMYFYLVFT